VKTTGEFRVHAYEIPFKKYGEPINLIPFGDVHFGSKMFAKDKWEKFKKEVKALPNCWFIGIGDYFDAVRASERAALKNIEEPESSISKHLSESVMRELEDFYEEISFMKGRVIGLVGGNHSYTFKADVTSDQVLCQKLDCAFLGVKTLISLVLRDVKQGGHHGHRLVMSIHHGTGGGGLPGGSVNKLYHDANNFDCDIVLQGHDHQRSATYHPRVGLSDSHRSPRAVTRNILMARTGNFLYGYIHGQRSYPCDKNMSPNNVGYIRILLTPTIDREMFRGKLIREERYVDIKAIV
jgi:hypothetical protein